MLSYYFNVIPIFKLVKPANKSTTITNNVEINKLIQSNIPTIFSTIIPSINTTFTQDELDLIEEHSDYIQLCSVRYDELSAMGADTSKCTLVSNQYSKYIKLYKEKLLGSMTETSQVDGISNFYHGQSTLFHQLISPLSRVKCSRKGDYNYIDVNDVCQYFNDNPSDYNQMIGENGYLFKLDNKSIGRYMSQNSRFWDKMTKDGKAVYRVK